MFFITVPSADLSIAHNNKLNNNEHSKTNWTLKWSLRPYSRSGATHAYPPEKHPHLCTLSVKG
jgi:hypothetical protein